MSIKSIFTLLIMIGVGYSLYSMITDSTSMLIVGLTGIIAVLLFAIASGYGRTPQTIIVNQKCDTKPPSNGLEWLQAPKKNIGCPKSFLKPAGVCPTGYYNYTDGDGNTLCCGSKNIDPYAHTCPAMGPLGVCSMAPGIKDERSVNGKKSYYPLCQDITKKQEVELSRKTCPPQYPYLRMSDSDTGYKCCASEISCDTSCDRLKSDKDIFTSSNSCEALKFLSELECTDLSKPILITLSGELYGGKGTKRVPVCPKNNSFPRIVLEKCVSLGFCSNITIAKNRYNADVAKNINNTNYFKWLNDNGIQDIYPNFFA
jgi:hypothetical protein